MKNRNDALEAHRDALEMEKVSILGDDSIPVEQEWCMVPNAKELGFGASHEDAAYVGGWNDCRDEMLNAALTPPKSEPEDFDMQSMDGAVWAKAFADRVTVWSTENGVESDTFGLMVGWFANAIMAGFDEANRRSNPCDRNAVIEECLQCYSPDDSATDWADKIRRLKL